MPIAGQTFWILASILAFAALWLLLVAVTLEWRILPHRWRPVVVVVMVQQGVIAYGCWEAFGSHVSGQARVYLNVAVLACLLAAVVYVLIDRYRTARRRPARCRRDTAVLTPSGR